jgi:predicted secreted Zn-dependent protease
MACGGFLRSFPGQDLYGVAGRNGLARSIPHRAIRTSRKVGWVRHKHAEGSVCTQTAVATTLIDEWEVIVERSSTALMASIR